MLLKMENGTNPLRFAMIKNAIVIEHDAHSTCNLSVALHVGRRGGPRRGLASTALLPASVAWPPGPRRRPASWQCGAMRRSAEAHRPGALWQAVVAKKRATVLQGVPRSKSVSTHLR